MFNTSVETFFKYYYYFNLDCEHEDGQLKDAMMQSHLINKRRKNFALWQVLLTKTENW